MTENDKRHLTAAEGWLELGDWRQANAELEEMAPLIRATAPVLALRCRIYAAAKKCETARDIGRLVAETLSANAEMLLALARCCCVLEDHLEGRRWLERAINLNRTPEFRLRIVDDPIFAAALTAGP